MEPEDKKFFEDLAKNDFNFLKPKMILENEPSETGKTPMMFQPELIKAEMAVARKIAKIRTEEKEPEPLNDEEGQLTVDVYQNDEEIVIQSTIAGVESEDLEINITADSVTIKGFRRQPEKVEDDNYLYQECFWGHFARSIILPQEVEADRSTANLKNGVLIIRMPKLNRQKAKKIKVKIS